MIQFLILIASFLPSSAVVLPSSAVVLPRASSTLSDQSGLTSYVHTKRGLYRTYSNKLVNAWEGQDGLVRTVSQRIVGIAKGKKDPPAMSFPDFSDDLPEPTFEVQRRASFRERKGKEPVNRPPRREVMDSKDDEDSGDDIIFDRPSGKLRERIYRPRPQASKRLSGMSLKEEGNRALMQKRRSVQLTDVSTRNFMEPEVSVYDNPPVIDYKTRYLAPDTGPTRYGMGVNDMRRGAASSVQMNGGGGYNGRYEDRYPQPQQPYGGVPQYGIGRRHTSFVPQNNERLNTLYERSSERSSWENQLQDSYNQRRNDKRDLHHGTIGAQADAVDERQSLGKTVQKDQRAKSQSTTGNFTDQQTEFNTYLEAYHRTQKNISDLIMPVFKDITGNTNSSLVYNALWSIWAELTYAPIRIMGPFIGSFNAMDWIEQKYFNDTDGYFKSMMAKDDSELTDTDLFVLNWFAVHDTLLDIYNHAYDNALKAVNETGLLETLDHLSMCLHPVDTAIIPPDFKHDKGLIGDGSDFFTNHTASNDRLTGDPVIRLIFPSSDSAEHHSSKQDTGERRDKANSKEHMQEPGNVPQAG